MLASSPASILNQTSNPLGIPRDSYFSLDALGHGWISTVYRLFRILVEMNLLSVVGADCTMGGSEVDANVGPVAIASSAPRIPRAITLELKLIGAGEC